MNLYQRLLSRGWWIIILLYAAALFFAGRFLPGFSVEAGTDVLLNEDDPDLAYYNETRTWWDYDEYIIVCLSRKNGWFSPPALELLTGLAKELEEIRTVREGQEIRLVQRVTCLTNIPLLRNKPPTFGFPQPVYLAHPKTGKIDSTVDLAKAEEELRNHTQARGNLISANGQDVSVLVYFNVPEDIIRYEPYRNKLLIEHKKKETSPERRAAIERELRDEVDPKYKKAKDILTREREVFVNAVREVAKRWANRFDEPARLSGLPHVNISLLEHIRADLRMFGWLSFAFFALLYVAIYRRPRWVTLPMAACLIPVVIILGTMAATGRVVTVITSNLPILLFVLMLPYSVYFIERYLERRSLHPTESGRDTTTRAPLEIWVPCLYSCTTTMAGTASLMTSGISPVRTFGMMMTIGMALGLLTMMLLLPSTVLPLRALRVTGFGAQYEPIAPVRPLIAAVLKIPLVIVLVSLVILGVSIWGMTKLNVETKFIDYFWPKSEIYQGLDHIDNRMGGTTPFEVMLEAPSARILKCTRCKKHVEPDGVDTENKCRTCGRKIVELGYFETSEGLTALEAVGAFFAGVPETGNVRSLHTLVDEVKKAMPQSKGEDILATLKTIAPSQLREFSTADASTSRVLVRMRETAPTLNRNQILADLRKHLHGLESQALNGIREVRPTGVFLLYANMLNSLIQSQKDTFAMVLAAIWVMLVVLFLQFPGLSKGGSTALGVATFTITAVALWAWLAFILRDPRPLLTVTETAWVVRWLGISLVMLLVVAVGICIKGKASTLRWMCETAVLPTMVLLPQVLPVCLVLGVMGFVGIPLDMVTVMIASMAMGVGIDAAIQYTVRFRAELIVTNGDIPTAIRRSHATIGRSIMIATSIVFAGFAILAFSQFVPTVYFGLFTGLAMLMGLFGSLTTLPAMFLLLRYPRLPQRT